MATSSISAAGFNSSIGEQQFLQLMAAQLQYQNPLDPVQQQDMLSQLAQFSTLGGIEKLNSNFDDLFRLQSLTQGAGLVGKTVKYISVATGEVATGTVDRAGLSGGKLAVTVNGEDVSLDYLLAVVSDTAPAN